jgi:hypothetical protein
MRSSLALLFSIGLLALSEICRAATAPCAWPLEITGSGPTNVFYPDTNATYWVMPVDTSAWQSLTATGRYTDSRFFSFTTYYNLSHPSPKVVDNIIDADIAPDRGSVNPFQHPFVIPGLGRDYTITFDGNSSGTGNHVQWAADQATYIVYRIYIPDRGLGRKAGARLPALTLTDMQGNSQVLQKCPAGTGASELQSLLASITPPPPQTCPTSQPQPTSFAFAPGTDGDGLFGNPVTTYASERNLCLTTGQIIVVRGRAADFPDTYHGTSIFIPTLPGALQLRYWSLCNNKEESPRPVVACKADFDTPLDLQRFYTYVISTDSSRPAWVPPGVAWLPWGDPSIQNALIFRDMLAEPGFTLTGPYLPTGAFCDPQTFRDGGWQACFAAAAQ